MRPSSLCYDFLGEQLIDEADMSVVADAGTEFNYVYQDAGAVPVNSATI